MDLGHKGFYSENVNGNYRITFRFEYGKALDVDYLNYHLKGGKKTMSEQEMMMMSSPAHPGEIVRELCLEPLGLTVTATAKALGVTRKSLSELLNGKSGISPEMSLRLSMAFNTTAEFWFNMQREYDLAQARKKAKKLKVQKLYTGEELPNHA